jgi:cell division protein FtsN
MVESLTMSRSTPSAKKFSLSPFMAGLAAGLLFAGGLALYITQSPLPFVDRVGTRADSKSATAKGQSTADPNKSLLPKDVGIMESPAEAGIEPSVVSPAGMSYLIQVGAFKTPEDAEQMRARMAILGFEAKVSNVDRDGMVLHRVRLGPYPSIEDLNRARSRVEENGIESVIIRVGVGEQQ